MSNKFYIDIQQVFIFYFSFKLIKRVFVFNFCKYLLSNLWDQRFGIQFRYNDYQFDLKKTANYAVDYNKEYVLV